MIAERLRKIGRAAPREQLGQVLALHILLGDEVHAVDAADFVDLHDVGMHQRGRGAGFVMKRSHVRGVGGQVAAADTLNATCRRSESCSAR